MGKLKSWRSRRRTMIHRTEPPLTALMRSRWRSYSGTGLGVGEMDALVGVEEGSGEKGGPGGHQGEDDVGVEVNRATMIEGVEVALEVLAIQLDDIDWRTGEILIRGKGKLHDRMPLPADVGEAIVDYIRNGRAGHSRALFVSARTPHHRPFKDAQIVNTVLEDAFRKTGLKPPQKYVGSHLLRHRSRMTTTI